MRRKHYPEPLPLTDPYSECLVTVRLSNGESWTIAIQDAVIRSFMGREKDDHIHTALQLAKIYREGHAA